MEHSGKIISWNADKGFGFIQPKYGGKDIFVHISDFNDRSNKPEVGQSITFVLATDNDGKYCGKRVGRSTDKRIPSRSHLSENLTLVFAVLFSVLVTYSVKNNNIPIEMLWFYLAINSVTFILYLSDKVAAKQGRWRTKESTLHFVALLGGWPSAAFAQQILRHKSKKLSFRITYWLTMALNTAGFCLILVPEVQIFLLTLLTG